MELRCADEALSCGTVGEVVAVADLIAPLVHGKGELVFG